MRVPMTVKALLASSFLCAPAGAQELSSSMQELLGQARSAREGMAKRPSENGRYKELAARVLQNMAGIRLWGEKVEVETAHVKGDGGRSYTLSALGDQSLKKLSNVIAYEWTVTPIQDGVRKSYRGIVMDLSGRPVETRSGVITATQKTSETPNAEEAASFATDLPVLFQRLGVSGMEGIYAALPKRGIPLNLADPEGPRMLVYWKHDGHWYTSQDKRERWEAAYEGRLGQKGADYVLMKKYVTADKDGKVRKNDVTLYRVDFQGNLKSYDRTTLDTTPPDRAEPQRPAKGDAAEFDRIAGRVFPTGR